MKLSAPITLASRNRGKLAELETLASGALALRLLPAEPEPPEVVEDAATYLGNATKKALAIARFVGGAALADDSGLEVDALGGRPGVLSARYGGPGLSDAERCARLLDELRGASDRAARFRCVLVLAPAPEGGVIAAEGVLEGTIALALRGAHGFGYDPVFVAPELGGRTLAEVAAAEKNLMSHRARAMRALLERIGGSSGPAGAPDLGGAASTG
jgi:XTP/dITP diphosphohydrolase